VAEAIPLCLLPAAGGAAAGIWLAGALHRTTSIPVAGALTDAWQAGAAVAVGAMLILLAPALSKVTPGTARVRRGRQAAISTASRAGADLGLIVLAVLACWQLRHYSAVSAGTSGTFGVDPVVVLAPALALAAGTVTALRLLPLAGRAGDQLAARGRRLVTALASWQISRQPIRQAGAALLIVLAVATATLALTQRQSWIRSGNDQAAFSAGADVQVQAIQPLTAAQAATLTSTPGVRQAMPVATYTYAAGTSDVLAVDAATAPDVALLRADQAPVPESTLFREIRTAGQAPGVTVAGKPSPGQPAQVELTAKFGPASLGLAPASVVLTVEDADDGVYQPRAVTLAADGRPHTFTIPVTPGGHGVIYPLRVTAITVSYTLPARAPPAPAAFTVDSLSGGPGTRQLTGSALDRFTALATSPDLEATIGTVGRSSEPGPVSPGAAGTTGGPRTAVFEPGYGLASNGPGVPPSTLGAQLALTALSPIADHVIPGIATQSFLAASSASVGSTIQATMDGATIGVRIVAAVAAFPTVTDSSGAVIVDLADVQNYLNGRSLPPAPVEQWWLATAGHAVPAAISARLPGGATVTSMTAIASGLLNDPLSNVPQQALVGMAIAALLLASTGFCVSIAAGVRQRRAENALLAALGLTPRAAAGQLCLEKFMLSLPSAAAGLVLGAVLAELLVPAITLSATATTPEPPVLIQFGWLPTLAAAVFLAVLPVLAAALVMVRRPDAAASLRAAEAA
jgi:FtsX-like permease family